MLVDENIRLEALDPKQSFIVQAPAGSGKTYLLVQRFIKLLATCNSPEECLAITFTKKAAYEMRYRVLQTIEQQNLANSSINNIYDQIIIEPNRLKILTIDAFCFSLIEKMPISSKLGVDIKIAEDPKKLYLAAVEQFLKTASQSDELSNDLIILFDHLNNNYSGITDLLITMLAKREQWLPLIMPLKNQNDIKLKEKLDFDIKIVIEEILEQILEYLPNNDYSTRIIRIAKQVADNLQYMGSKNNIVFCSNLVDSWPQAKVSDLPAWRGLVELLLNKDGSPRAQVSTKQGFLAVSTIKDPKEKKIAAALKNDMQDILAYLAEHEFAFLQKLQQVTLLPDTDYQLTDWKILQSLFKLLPELAAHLMVVFQEQQQVDFVQVAIAALDALGDENPTELALLLDYKIQHILVDEFQDTSILQFNLLRKMLINWQPDDGRTIFLVGDPMQSIYRFRQADVGLFLITQKYGIANVKLKNLYLSTNFRSSRIIIDNLNKLFVNIFPKQHDEILGGISYSAANVVNKELYKKTSKIQFISTNNAKQEADSILRLIKAIQAEHQVNHSIAILVRARSNANLIINNFRHYGIKFQSADLELLSDQIIINDLIVLTKAILHINDIISWLALLRSPLVGLTLLDLHVLFEQNDAPLFTILCAYKNNPALSLDAKVRLDYVLPILLYAIDQKDSSINLSKLIKKTWLQLGGYLLLEQQELPLVEDFFHTLLKISNINNINIIEELLYKNFITVNQGDIDLNSIQIMTIHKAKGLEFDSVIVPGMSNKNANFDPQLLLWQEIFSRKLNNKCLLFAVAKSANYNCIKYLEQQGNLYEEQRLLYVAMTRAKQNFYGFCNSANNSQKNNFFSFLKPHVIFQEINESDSILNVHPEQQVVNMQKRIPSTWYDSKR